MLLCRVYPRTDQYADREAEGSRVYRLSRAKVARCHMIFAIPSRSNPKRISRAAGVIASRSSIPTKAALSTGCEWLGSIITTGQPTEPSPLQRLFGLCSHVCWPIGREIRPCPTGSMRRWRGGGCRASIRNSTDFLRNSYVCARVCAEENPEHIACMRGNAPLLRASLSPYFLK